MKKSNLYIVILSKVLLCILILFSSFALVTDASAQGFNFDSNNEAWRLVGWYDAGSLTPIPGFFADIEAPWSNSFGNPVLGGIMCGTGGGGIPESPTDNFFVHWDLNSPELETYFDWQGIGSFSYRVSGGDIDTGGETISVQAVLRVRRPDLSETYYTDSAFNVIPRNLNEWDTYTVNIAALGMPPGTTILQLGLRFFFTAGSWYENVAWVDHVFPSGSICGDGWVRRGEECDDGNTIDGDGCSADCLLECEFGHNEQCDDGNPCTRDICGDDGACDYTYLYGSSCDDGIYCSSCYDGVCEYEESNCDDGLFCNGVEICNESGDSCVSTGDPCPDDGTFCNGSESCDEVSDSCVSSGDPCIDGPECNNECQEASDTCFNTSGTACTDDGNVCTNDVCDGTGTCAHPNNSAPCDDLLFCNGADSCSGGSCSVHTGDPCAEGAECNNSCQEASDTCFNPSGTACADDGNVCTDDQCNGAGTCSHPANTASCDDGLYCNGTDTCSGASCSVHAGNPCAGGAECNNSCQEASDTCFNPSGTACTDDGNVCTDDQCNGAGTCSHPANTASCDDGLYCNGTDTCSGASCSVHTGNPCAGGAECNNSCQEASDTCFNPSGTACADDGNVCTDDQCNGAGTCSHPANTASCDDGLYCNGTDTCSGASCSVHAGNPCAGGAECNNSCQEASDTCFNPSGTACADDGNVCTDDQCNGAGTCSHPANTASCDDGLYCNGTDTCSGASCSVHAGNPCAGGAECNNSCQEASDTCFNPSGTACTDDGNVCTDDQCNGAGTCSHPANTASCDDGLYCNGTDTCSGASCSVHTGNPCAGGAECNNSCQEASDTCFNPSGTACTDDGNVCTDDQCNGAGTCSHPANTASCDDGLYCNGTDTCSGASCSVHVGNPCPGSDGDIDCSESCNEAGNNCLAPDPDGVSCNDGQFCTVTDTCNNGDCTGTGDPCIDGPECNNECQEGTDSCFNTVGTFCGNPTDTECTNPDTCDGVGECLPNHTSSGTACPNGEFCDGEETCDGSGSCQDGPDPNCNDNVICTDDYCDEAVDTCVNESNDANCDDEIACTMDTCDPLAGCQNTPNDSLCDDNAYCTGVEYCDAVSDCRRTEDPCAQLGLVCEEEDDYCRESTVTLAVLDSYGSPGIIAISLENLIDEVRDINFELCDPKINVWLDILPGQCNPDEDEPTNHLPAGALCNITDPEPDDGCITIVIQAAEPYIERGIGIIAEVDYTFLDPEPGIGEFAHIIPVNPDIRYDSNFSLDVTPMPGQVVSICQTDEECNDGMYCNGIEACDIENGTCQAGTPVDCSDEEFCTVNERCDEENDQCTSDPRACDCGCDEDYNSCRFPCSPPPPPTPPPTTIICEVQITPLSPVSLKSEETVTFNAVTFCDGVEVAEASYVWEIENDSTIGSTISETTGVYEAGDNATDAAIEETITVTDTINEVSANVTVLVLADDACEVEIVLPEQIQIIPGETFELSAETHCGEGGEREGNYIWEIVPANSIGSEIDPAGPSVDYTVGEDFDPCAPFTTDIIRVMDEANGNLIEEIQISVNPNKLLLVTQNGSDISDITLAPHTTVALSANIILRVGGKVCTDPPPTPVPPLYRWTVNSTNDQSEGASYSYTAGSGPDTDTITVSDVNDVGVTTDITITIIAPGSLPEGSSQTNYRMISVPYDTNDCDALCITPYFNYDDTDVRLFRWDPTLTPTEESDDLYREYPDSPTSNDDYSDKFWKSIPGNAFWAITSGGGIIQPKDLGDIGTPTPTDEPFEIELKAGWNQIGNPFPFQVNWMNITASGTQVEQPRPYEGGPSYPFANMLEPWKGYFVLSTNDGTISIPAEPMDSNTLMKLKTTGFLTAGQEGFELQIGVHKMPFLALGDVYNYIGLSEGSHAGYDPKDQHEPPPLFSNQASLYFPHEWEGKQERYDTDFRSLDSEYEVFEFTVNSGWGIINLMKLSWSDMPEVQPEYHLELSDPATGFTVNMRNFKQYWFISFLGLPRHFTITMTKGAD